MRFLPSLAVIPLSADVTVTCDGDLCETDQEGTVTLEGTVAAPLVSAQSDGVPPTGAGRERMCSSVLPPRPSISAEDKQCRLAKLA